MISQILLDSVVEKVFPQDFLPRKSKNIVSVSCVSSSKIKKIRRSYYPDYEEPKEFLGALALSLGHIYQQGSEYVEECKDKYVLYVCEDINDTEELSYILVNQLGLIHLNINYPDRQRVDDSLYADFFAIGVLEKLYGHDRASEMANKYGSIIGE
jgi:hypothetical protein